MQRRSFSLFLASLISAGAARRSLGASTVAPKQRPAAHRVILCNDGGTLGAPDREAPIGVEGLVQETFDPLLDTMIDTLYWQLGTDPYFGTPTNRLSDWYSHRTKVGVR